MRYTWQYSNIDMGWNGWRMHLFASRCPEAIFYGYAEAAQLNVAVFETSPKDSLEHLDARSLRRTCNDLEEKWASMEAASYQTNSINHSPELGFFLNVPPAQRGEFFLMLFKSNSISRCRLSSIWVSISMMLRTNFAMVKFSEELLAQNECLTRLMIWHEINSESFASCMKTSLVGCAFFRL